MSLITPAQVIDYTDFDVVKERDTAKIEKDILQAEADIFEEAGHDFSDEIYESIPDKAELALIKVAEYYALINSDESIAKGIKSEKLEGYSYTLADGTVIKKPAIHNLIKPYIKKYDTTGNLNFRMRAL
jgi:uncharacterized protein DUF3199